MKKNSFLEGAFIATAAIFVSKILGLIYVIPFYSIIGEQGGALYGYAYNIYNLFLTISTAGIPLAISKLTSEYATLGMQAEKEKMFKIARNAILIFSILSFAICFFFSQELATLIIGDIEGGNTIEDVSFVIKMISFALLIVPYSSILRGYLQGHKYMSAPSISQVIEQLVRVLIIIIGSYLTIRVFNLSLATSIGVVVFGATIGGLASYFYLIGKYSKVKKENKRDVNSKESSVSGKEILKKIITYSIPFIIISVANNLYYNIDMILILRTLSKLGYDAKTVESVTSVFTTWGVKIDIIVLSVATGLITSLIPHVVSSYVKNDMDDVNIKFNKSIKVLLLIIVPLALFLSLMSESVWFLFYGSNTVGASIIKYMVLTTIIQCAYMMVNSLFQGINKSKLIYISVIVGLGINAVLAVPLMVLCYNLDFPAFYGAIMATVIGYSLSVFISFAYLKKKFKFNYHSSTKLLPKIIVGSILMVILSYGLKAIINIQETSRIMQIPILGIAAIVLFGGFFLINYKDYFEIIPSKYLDKIKRIIKK